MDFFDILLAKKLENDKDVSIVQLNVSENGTYSESGKAYSPVVVDVQPPSNSYLRTPIDSYPTTAEQLPIPKCDVEIVNQKSCKVFVSNKPFVNDKTPYIYRASVGGDRVYEKLIGGTIAWNQLVNNGDFASVGDWRAYDTNKESLSVANNVAMLTYSVAVTNGGGYAYGLVNYEIEVPLNHKVIMIADVNQSFSGNIRFEIGANLNNPIQIPAGSWTTVSALNIKSSQSNTVVIKPEMSTWDIGATLKIRNVRIFDLTQMFGSTIADYIYSLEQATAGAGVAWFRALFPNDYYAYDTGSLQSVNVASKKVYDSNNTLVATYAFDSDLTLRGIPKLDANNNLYYDGDVYESDGTVTRKYGIVDLGSLTWTKASNNSRFYLTLSDVKAPSSNDAIANIVCAMYQSTSFNDNITPHDKTIAIDTQKALSIYDSAYTDAQTFKTAMSGVYLIYELATPTTESADPYTNPQMVDADGTEEFVDYGVEQETRDVAVPVGHESLYYNGQLYQTDFEQATTDTINMAELHSIVPPRGEFYMTANGTLSVDAWKK